MKQKKDCLIEKLRRYFPLCGRDWLIFAGSLTVAAAVCSLLKMTTTSDVHVPLIFVLAVLVVSLLTEGYFYGFLASLISVVGVNFAFTYPYLKLDFSIYGYPLTFLTMLAVGFAVSTLTSRLKAEEELRIESEREKMRANLLRAISHDLRTPLTAISGSISTVLEDGRFLTEAQKTELLTGARQDAEWLYRMVENLLSITRIGGGETGRIKKNDELLEEVLSEAVQTFRKHHAGIGVSVSVPEDLMLLPMDAMLIEQVLLNVMDNAVTHGGAKQITIDAAAADSFAVIHIADNGSGIDKTVLPHLFDGTLPLYNGGRADDTRSVGIGLSVCRTIVEAHGGKIFAENRSCGGARFTFTLPFGGKSQ